MLRYLGYGTKDFSLGSIPVMSRFNWEFYVCLSGKLRATGEAMAREGWRDAPALWVFPPNHPHGWESTGRFLRAVFHYTTVPEVIRREVEQKGHLCLALEPADAAMLDQLGQSLEPHFRAPTPASALLFDRALIELSLLLLRGRSFGKTLSRETVAMERVERAKEWYLAHLHARPSLEALAEAAHISVAHLRREFRIAHGKSPHAVLTQLRVERASQLLANGGHTLDVIAKQSGFNSASDLCRVFKRNLKVYPNAWRTQVAGQELPESQARRLVARVDPVAAARTERELDAGILAQKRKRPARIRMAAG
jgi:AraC family transcriptional regulator